MVDTDFSQWVMVGVFIDVLLFLGQASINHMEPGYGIEMMNYDGSLLQSFDRGNYTMNDDLTALLPQASSSVSTDFSGNIFTDPFTTFKNYITSSLSIFYDLFAGPGNLVKMIFPQETELSFAVGSMWMIFSVFIILLWLKG